MPRPTGVRLASTMTAVRMGPPRGNDGCFQFPRSLASAGMRGSTYRGSTEPFRSQPNRVKMKASPGRPMPPTSAHSLEALLAECQKVIVGQPLLLNRLLVALLCRGHVLLEGLPGLAKTRTLSLIHI